MGLVGLIPAAGKATRLGGLPKFLLPCPHGAGHLLGAMVERMLGVGASDVLVGASEDTYPFVRRFLPHGATAYLVNSETMSETLLAARRWCSTENVLFGMPDTWTFQGDGGFTGVASLVTRGAFAVAGLWSVHESQQSALGMVHTATQATGRLVVTNITDKPKARIATDKAWGTLAWSPAFWQYIEPTDPTVGLGLVRALANQQPITATLNKLGYYDCGTPQRYYELCKMFASSPRGEGAL